MKKKLLEEYRELEDKNLHNEAALLLVRKFGTAQEVKRLKAIRVNHEARGHLLFDEQRERFEISNKYYKLLKS